MYLMYFLHIYIYISLFKCVFLLWCFQSLWHLSALDPAESCRVKPRVVEKYFSQ